MRLFHSHCAYRRVRKGWEIVGAIVGTLVGFGGVKDYCSILKQKRIKFFWRVT